MNAGNSITKEKSEFDDELIHVRKIPTGNNVTKNEQISEIPKTLGFEEIGQNDVNSENITHQYLKFVNAHLSERLHLVEKLVQLKNNLEKEIELLKFDDLSDMIKLPNISINHLKPNEIRELDTFMKLQKDLSQSKNNFHENDLEEKVTQTNISKKPISESDELVKDELGFLIKKYGMKELTYAIDVITSSKIIKQNQNLE